MATYIDSYNALKKHIGHVIRCKPLPNKKEVVVECVDCKNKVLLKVAKDESGGEKDSSS